ncbi:anti-sigma factor domain-containing protein [Marinicrinis lubricantis]|uniref:Anti-sigma factor domain-containing protein n=1 Tax=Marinicrinis lubricantis TaxID=2086470 RepID=A0ABW1IQK7_9BACL
MRKGLVMEIERRSIIVMTSDGQFVRIPRRNRVCDIGEEIAFPRSSFRAPNRLYSLAAVCTAAVVLIFALFSGLTFFSQPAVAAYVTMDINPSIELGIDEDEKVIEAEGLNDEGHKLLEEVDVIGLPLREAANAVLEKAAPVLAKYGEDEGTSEIVITSMVIKLEYEKEENQYIDEVKASMETHLQKQFEQDQLKLNITVLSVPKELRESAKEIGVSSGKLAVKMLAEKEGILISEESLKNKSLTEISKEVEGLGEVIRQHTEDSKEVLQSMIQQNSGKKPSSGESSNAPVVQNGGGKGADNQSKGASDKQNGKKEEKTKPQQNGKANGQANHKNPVGEHPSDEKRSASMKQQTEEWVERFISEGQIVPVIEEELHLDLDSWNSSWRSQFEMLDPNEWNHRDAGNEEQWEEQDDRDEDQNSNHANEWSRGRGQEQSNKDWGGNQAVEEADSNGKQTEGQQQPNRHSKEEKDKDKEKEKDKEDDKGPKEKDNENRRNESNRESNRAEQRENHPSQSQQGQNQRSNDDRQQRQNELREAFNAWFSR